MILSNVIEPKFKRKDLDEMEYSTLKDLAETVFNLSISSLSSVVVGTHIINEKLFNYENKVFNLNEEINKLLDNKINYDLAITLIQEENSPKNLIWLKSLINNESIREEKSIRFPIEKVVITEGITEEILLPVFAEHLGLNFDKNGIQVISAGGKNQVVKLVYTLANQLKLPMFILLDNDAKENYEQILPKLREFDKIYLLSHANLRIYYQKSLL